MYFAIVKLNKFQGYMLLTAESIIPSTHSLVSWLFLQFLFFTTADLFINITTLNTTWPALLRLSAFSQVCVSFIVKLSVFQLYQD